ncbi:MAG: hypothetical protein R2725_08450 [Solirubrobacterales bacterium]
MLAAVALFSGVADFLTYLALVAVPPLSAAALAWLVHGGRPALALLVSPLFALAWAAKGTLGGEAAALALSATACVTLGWLLASVIEPRWLKLGIYATAAVDAYLVGAELLQSPNSVINAAAPGIGLPQLQFVSFGSARMGFADLFVAALLAALFARNRPLQLRVAVLAAAVCVASDFLFFAFDLLPATVPLAITLALTELTSRLRRGRGWRQPGRDQRGEDAGPRP